MRLTYVGCLVPELKAFKKKNLEQQSKIWPRKSAIWREIALCQTVSEEIRDDFPIFRLFPPKI